MDSTTFGTEVKHIVSEYELSKHPYVELVSQGKLSREQLKGYPLQHYEMTVRDSAPVDNDDLLADAGDRSDRDRGRTQRSLRGLGVSAKARRRKDYRIALSGPPSLPDSELVVELCDVRGALVRRFDFGVLGAPPVMARELALAFHGHLADKSPAVWYATFGSGIRYWLRFLSEREGWAARIESLREVDRAVLCEFIAWLERLPHRIGTSYSRWSSFKQLLAWLQRHRPELMHAELELPFNPFPRKNAAALGTGLISG